MNYLAHGMRFVDRPWFLVGTAVPDLLSVADRGVRMRERRVRPVLEAESGDIDPTTREIAGGVLQHLHDDDWFHRTPGFFAVTDRLAAMFRAAVGTDGFRCGFLGHIAMEMLLDAVLADREPTRLARYYEALERVDAAVVQDVVNHLARRPTTRLAAFVETFRRLRFLEDYRTAAGLLHRLNQVLQRITLAPLPPEAVAVVERGYLLVETSLESLLPADRFGPLDGSRARLHFPDRPHSPVAADPGEAKGGRPETRTDR